MDKQKTQIESDIPISEEQDSFHSYRIFATQIINFTECIDVKVKLETEKDLDKKSEVENSLNTKVKEKDVKKGIKSEENTYDVKIKYEYKVPSNCKVQESKSKKKNIKVKVKKMELRSKDRFCKTIKSKLRQHSKGSKDKIFVSSPVQKMDKKDVLKVQQKEKKIVKKEEKSVQYDKEENKEGVLDVSKYFENRWEKREDLNERHISHIDLDFDKDYLHNQKIPGYCLLCTSFYSSKPSVMKYHFVRIHKKHSCK